MTIKVLVVEDESLVRVTAVDVLRDAGFDVMEAADGERALALYRSAPVDVLLTDVCLPGRMSGWDVAERCRDANPQLPVIYASGAAGFPPRPVPQSVGFQKPYTAEQLVSIVRTAAQADPRTPGTLDGEKIERAARPGCAECGELMRVIHIVPRLASHGEIRSYACDACGVIITPPEQNG